MNYPYQKAFNLSLESNSLSPSTILEYNYDIHDFFNYLLNFNDAFSNPIMVETILESDVRQYLTMLQDKRNIKNSTYTKVLSHLNGYFKYLFTHQINTHIPTLMLKGKKNIANSVITFNWLIDFDSYLFNSEISYYSRLVLLMTRHFFKISEILQPGFFVSFKQLTFTETEELFLKQFNTYIKQLQILQNSNDCFLKLRKNVEAPLLSLPGLHKFLKKDLQFIAPNVSPRLLYQSAICFFILTNNTMTDSEIMMTLRIDPNSLLYYRHLIIEQKLII
ncbi:site-specific integrase [Dellaglioa sp. P0083]|uniref:site-specific integrase n=1 Tax=Dellaglioa kimchii TaxID=3344667 RepID=UPI0038D3CEDA